MMEGPEGRGANREQYRQHQRDEGRENPVQFATAPQRLSWPEGSFVVSVQYLLYCPMNVVTCLFLLCNDKVCSYWAVMVFHYLNNLNKRYLVLFGIPNFTVHVLVSLIAIIFMSFSTASRVGAKKSTEQRWSLTTESKLVFVETSVGVIWAFYPEFSSVT